MVSPYFIFEKRLAQTHHTLTRVYHNPTNSMVEACAIKHTLQRVGECSFAKCLLSRW